MDIRPDDLSATARLLSGKGNRCYALDMSDQAADVFAARVARELGILINNAGMALGAVLRFPN